MSDAALYIGGFALLAVALAGFSLALVWPLARVAGVGALLSVALTLLLYQRNLLSGEVEPVALVVVSVGLMLPFVAGGALALVSRRLVRLWRVRGR